MKKKILPSVVCASLALGAIGANAQDMGWYVGGSLAQSRLKEDLDGPARDIANLSAEILQDAGYTVLDVSGTGDEEDSAYKLYVGYRVGPNLGFEAGYVDLGGFDFRSTVTATDGVDTATGGVKGSIDSAGVFVSMLGFYPVSDAFDLFGKVGMYYYDTDADMTIFASDSVSSVSEKVSGGNSDEEVTWGLGARYSFNQFAVRFEYERYERIEADEDLDLQADVDLWSVGLEYSF